MKFVLFNPWIEKILCFFYISHGDSLDLRFREREESRMNSRLLQKDSQGAQYPGLGNAESKPRDRILPQ